MCKHEVTKAPVHVPLREYDAVLAFARGHQGLTYDRFDAAMGIIEKICKSRKQVAPSPSSMVGMPGSYTPYPIEVVVGGATIFVLSVDQFVKL